MAAKIISQIEFIEYLAKLPADGETLLLVQQKPVKKDGEPVLHNDGTPKYTWIPSLPNKIKPETALYVNTGSFIIDRFQAGKLSASSANCEHVLFLMLDDVGTKSKQPPLEPTWKIETSPGNQQWGYVFDFDHQPTKGDFTAAITAIATAGYTDGGATNAVRNVRVPGSINLKSGKNNFVAKLIEFSPEREFTLEQICAALEVVPNDADTASMQRLALSDNGDDDILQWISDNGMLLESANGAGWYGIVCPNSNEHSDNNPMARYHPVNRAFCCYHEHCQDFDSHAYLAWAAQNGAPKHQPGVRSELLMEKMAKALEKITPSAMFSDTSAHIAEVQRKELARIEKEDWYERFAYVQDDDAYFDLVERREISRGTFNAIFRHINCRSIHTGRKIEASVCFDENRQAHNSKAVVGITYAAGESVFVGREGDIYGNRWVDARPDVENVSTSDISMWTNLLERLVPIEADRNHLLDIMAFKLQHPNIKINHAVLHVGDEGCGKDTMWAPFIWSVCGVRLKNRGYMDSDSLNSQWGYDLESEILIINELKEPDAAARRALANKLKPIIAAPPEMLNINRKGLHPYQMANRLFVLAFSNEQIPISLASQDRRWFCIQSDTPRMTNGEGKRIWDWYNAGGFGQIAASLWDRDVSHFNPGETPGMTEFKMNLIEHGRSMAESFIVEMLKNRVGEFARGVVGSPFHLVCDKLASLAPSGTKVPQAALLHALKEAGWVDMGRIASAEYANKKHIFVAPELKDQYKKSELRRMIEVPPEPKAVVLDMKRSA